MKKLISLFILLFLLTACGTKSSTTSMLFVIDKGHSSEGKWIEVYDPNNQTKDEAFKIVIDEDNLWNLIMENTEYFATYESKRDNNIKITTIELSATEQLKKKDVK